MSSSFWFAKCKQLLTLSLFLGPSLGNCIENLKLKQEIMTVTSSIEILNAKELFEKLNTADGQVAHQITLIDARESSFNQGHIPGSQMMNWEDWSEEKPGIGSAIFGNSEKWGRILKGPTVQQKLRKLGLSQNKMIVVIGDPKGWGEEGRIAWSLLYWGTSHVALLDGGFPAWKKAGYPVEGGKVKIPLPGDFKYAISNHRQATKTIVEENLRSGTRSLLDARTIEEYNGKKMPGQKRGGHIPGSKLIEFQKLYQSDGLYITADALKKLVGHEFTSAPITYCTGGVRSALLALLIEARLGIPALNYDASIWEWSADKKLPIEVEKVK